MMRTSAAVLLLILGAAAPVAAQSMSVAAGTQYQTYRFDPALGARSATLLLLPVAYAMPLGDRFTVDLYGAYARGAVEIGSQSYTLDGLVDTQLRAGWRATPWAMVTVGLNLPTGHESHTSDEARVASVLAGDMFGFRQANLGAGFGATTGVATAFRAGDWGFGVAGAYRMSTGYAPSADTALTFAPGNETRLRLAVDRTIDRSSKITGGVTVQYFTRDQMGGIDLFQPGPRIRADILYDFRSSRTATWSIYAANVYRANGEVTLPMLDPVTGTAMDTTYTTGRQNLLAAGLVGTIRLHPSLSVRPAADMRVLLRQDTGGEGAVLGAGLDLPFRIPGLLEVDPSGRVRLGFMQSASGGYYSFWGADLGATIRWSRRSRGF